MRSREIRHVILAETVWELFRQSSQGINNGSYFKSPDAGRAKDDPSMGLLPADGFLGQANKVASVSAH